MSPRARWGPYVKGELLFKYLQLNNVPESEEQGVGGKMPILQPDAVGGGWEEAHLTPDDPCSFRDCRDSYNNTPIHYFEPI